MIEDNLNAPFQEANWPLRVVVFVAIMLALVWSPYITLPLFHPGESGFRWPKNFLLFLDQQISQIEPLSISVFFAAKILFQTKAVSALQLAAIVGLHLVVAFFLISVRGEGGLRWLN